MSPEAASLKPSDFVEGGGLLDDEDVEISGAEFVEWNYGQEDRDMSLFLCITMSRDGEEDATQYYSAGSLEYFRPMNKGRGIEALGSATSLRTSTLAAQFLASIVDAGFPESKLGNDISSMVGTTCHVSRQAVKGGFNKKDSSGRDKTVLLVDNVITHPFMKGKKVTTTKVKANTPTPNGATTLVTKILTATKEGSIDVPTLYQRIFEELKDDSDTRTEVIATVSDNDNQFLTDGPWTFDGETLSM